MHVRFEIQIHKDWHTYQETVENHFMGGVAHLTGCRLTSSMKELTSQVIPE